jgi:hypothetical protein
MLRRSAMDDVMELDDRARAARADLRAGLDAPPPAFEWVLRGARRRRQRLVGAVAVIALATVGTAVSLDRGQDPTKVTAGPSAVAPDRNSDLLAPGETREMPSSPLAPRSTMASVWTGTEMLVWGGEGAGEFFDDGAGYDPRANTWRMLPAAPLSARNAPAAVWTGDEMILWGGHASGVDHRDGAAYNPATDSWRTIADAPMVSAGLPQAVWTGSEMIVLGGFNARTMASYDPATDRWEELADPPGAPSSPENHVVWTGSELVAQLQYPGGMRTGIFSYEPGEDRWKGLPPLADDDRSTWLFWTGNELLAAPLSPRTTVTAYDDDTDDWQGVAVWPNEPQPAVASAVWTGKTVLLWGGDEDALVLDPATGAWITTPAGGIPRRVQAAAVWADGVFILWGGWQNRGDGVVLRPLNPSATGDRADVAVPQPATVEPDYVQVAGADGSTPGTIDMNGPPATWNGRILPLHPVEDDDGNLVGYFGCRYFERAEVEADDFDPAAGCSTVTTVQEP